MTTERPAFSGQWLFLRLAVTTLVMCVGLALLAIATGEAPLRILFLCLILQAGSVLAGMGMAARGRDPRRILSWQLCLDVVMISVVLHFTGGLQSDFLLLYFFPVLVAAFSLQRRWAWATASLAGAMSLGYAVLLSAGYLVPVKPQLNRGLLESNATIEGQLMITLLLVVGYLAGEMSHRLALRTDLLNCQRRELSRVRRETKGILDSMSGGLLTLDSKGRVQRLNPAGERILGVGHELLIGRSVGESLGALMPVFVGHLMECLIEGRPIDRLEVNIGLGDGTSLPLGLSVSPQLDRDGTPNGAIAIFQDLTAVVRMRDRIRNNDRLAAMGELSATIAHEIRNPLASIRGSVEMLSGELELEGEDARLMELISKESARLDRLICDFLEYARLKPASLRRMRLNGIVEESAELLRNRLNLPPGLKVRVVGCGSDPVVEADEELIKQVFYNLGLNAFQAMGEVGALELRLQLHPELNPPEVQLRFLDEGPGIEEEDLPRLFSPFFTTKKSGTGLGLSVANRIVGNHGGKLEVRNLDGGGAEFAITLPLVGIYEDEQLIQGARLQEVLAY